MSLIAEIVLKYVPIVISAGALFVSFKSYRVNKKNTEDLQLPQLEIRHFHFNRTSKTCSMVCKDCNLKPYSVTKLLWIGDGNPSLRNYSKTSTIKVGQAVSDKYKNFMVDVVFEQSGIKRGTIKIFYKDIHGKRRALCTPSLTIDFNKCEVIDHFLIEGTYLIYSK